MYPICFTTGTKLYRNNMYNKPLRRDTLKDHFIFQVE